MAKHVFRCIDAHTCGNPVRLVAEGGPDLKGASMSEKRQHFLKEYDWIRTGLMFEPRGHDMMSGSILYPPSDPENDLGVLFIETSGCLPMCGHGTIGTITIGLQEGLIKPQKEGVIRMETPAGLVRVEYERKGEEIAWVKFTNVPSYLAAEGLSILSEDLGELSFDVGYGGNFYAIVDPQQNFSGLQDFKAEELISMSRKLRIKINEKYPNYFIHPENASINGVSHLLWTGETISEKAHGRNAVFYGDKAIDRSPCGTGTSARMAQMYGQGKLKEGDEFVHESYIGSVFTGKVEGLTKVGDFDAIIPSIKGWAHVYGYNTISIDENDPFAKGFQVI